MFYTVRNQIIEKILLLITVMISSGTFAADGETVPQSADEVEFSNLRARFSWYQDWNRDAYLFPLYPGYKNAKVKRLAKIAEKYDYDRKEIKSFTRIEYSPYVRRAGVYRPTGSAYLANGQKKETLTDQSIEAFFLSFRIEQTFTWKDFLTLTFDGEANINLIKPNTRTYQVTPLAGIVLSNGATYANGLNYALSTAEMREQTPGFNEETRQGSSTSSSYSTDGKTRYTTTTYFDYRVLKDSALPDGYAYVTLLEIGPRVFFGNSASWLADNAILYGVPNTSERPPLELTLRWRHIYWNSHGFNGSRYLELAYQPESKLATIYAEINHLFVLGVGYSFPLGNYKLGDINYPESGSFTRSLSVRLGISVSL